MKPTELWKALKSGLDATLAVRSFKRIKPSPPVWTRPHDGRALTLWFKSRSVGYEPGVGGAFTAALQLADVPAPGIEWKDGAFSSKRFYELFTEAELAEAQALFANVVARRTHRRDESFKAFDVWFVFLDDADIGAWVDLFQRCLTRTLDRDAGEIAARLG